MQIKSCTHQNKVGATGSQAKTPENLLRPDRPSANVTIEGSIRMHHSSMLLNLLTIIILLTSCSSSWSPVTVSLHDAAEDDPAYFPALKEASRNASVYRDFETKILINATFLSPQFRTAFNKRYAELMEEKHFSLAEADTKAGFFVSVFTADKQPPDLNDRKLWTLILKTSNGQQYFPSMVRSLNEKSRWQAFFPWLSQWSKEYLILFETESPPASAAPTVSSSDVLPDENEPELTLSISNPSARVEFHW
ncbi:MAG: hypothetical protein H6618_09910 [Deltaproteobacteria bacterium]|nr:hypothetical protein [Deltaproteobacteria bacterium]